MTFKHFMARSLHFTGCFIQYLATILLIGGLVGAFLFLSIGALTHPERPVSLRVSQGFVDGFLYAGVWAFGLSLVLCVMRWHKERQTAQTATRQTARS